MVSIRQIRASEGSTLRQIRLRAIRDTPTAFAVSLADTLAQSDEAWTAWATSSAEGNERVLYIAEDAGHWVGIAGGMLAASQNEPAQLISMWVDPAYRGQGIGRQLVLQIIAWARYRQTSRLELWVTVDNINAVSLYTRCGFRTTGDSQPLPSDPSLMEQKMTLDRQIS